MTYREAAKELGITQTRVWQLVNEFKQKNGREPTLDELRNRKTKVGRPIKNKLD